MKRLLVIDRDDAVAAWVAAHAPIERPVWVAPLRAFGVADGNDRLVAGIVFSNWRRDFSTVEMSAAAVSLFLSIETVDALGDYIFRQLHINRVEARTAADNERAKRVLKALGFTREATNADYYGRHRHAAVYRLLKHEWERWTRDRKARKESLGHAGRLIVPNATVQLVAGL